MRRRTVAVMPTDVLLTTCPRRNVPKKECEVDLGRILTGFFIPPKKILVRTVVWTVPVRQPTKHTYFRFGSFHRCSLGVRTYVCTYVCMYVCMCGCVKTNIKIQQVDRWRFSFPVLPTYLPTYLPTNIPTNQHTYLSIYSTYLQIRPIGGICSTKGRF